MHSYVLIFLFAPDGFDTLFVELRRFHVIRDRIQSRIAQCTTFNIEQQTTSQQHEHNKQTKHFITNDTVLLCNISNHPSHN